MFSKWYPIVANILVCRTVGGFPLLWRHTERHDVSNHQHLDCLLSNLFRRTTKKYQSSASLAFVRGIHRWPVDSPLKWPVTRKMFPFGDVFMLNSMQIRSWEMSTSHNRRLSRGSGIWPAFEVNRECTATHAWLYDGSYKISQMKSPLIPFWQWFILKISLNITVPRTSNMEIWRFVFKLLNKQSTCWWFQTSWRSYDVTVCVWTQWLCHPPLIYFNRFLTT